MHNVAERLWSSLFLSLAYSLAIASLLPLYFCTSSLQCNSHRFSFFFLSSSNGSVGLSNVNFIHRPPAAAAAAAANLRVWRILYAAGEKWRVGAQTASFNSANWTEKGTKTNLHRLALCLSFLSFSPFFGHLCPFILLLQKFSFNVHTHTYICNKTYCCLCVCVRICSCSRRLETTIAQVNGFAVVVANLTCLLFCCFYGLVWVLFCAGLRSLCLLLPRYRSLSLFLSCSLLSLYVFGSSFGVVVAAAAASGYHWTLPLFQQKPEMSRREQKELERVCTARRLQSILYPAVLYHRYTRVLFLANGENWFCW